MKTYYIYSKSTGEILGIYIGTAPEKQVDNNTAFLEVSNLEDPATIYVDPGTKEIKNKVLRDVTTNKTIV